LGGDSGELVVEIMQCCKIRHYNLHVSETCSKQWLVVM